MNSDVQIDELGAPINGAPQRSSRRLFMQFHAFGNCTNPMPIIDALQSHLPAALVYQDAVDPFGIAILTWQEDPNDFIDQVQPLLRTEPFSRLTSKPEFTMFGRTYSIGYEQDLEETLFKRPIRHATHPDYRWVIWYPLRRKGSFNLLSEDEQKAILREHGSIGYAFGKADYAHDIRLACHGMDRNDNDFVIGLMGKELHPLSAIVQAMRKTRQTGEYIEKLGPFFVGRRIWVHDGEE